MRRIVSVVSAVLMMWISGGAWGTTRYVMGSVSASGDGLSWETALKTIQEGIDAASPGDTVIVAEGTYLENIHFDGKNITLTSTDRLDPSVVANTIIDGNKAGSVVTFSGTETQACVLSGLTIRNGKTSGSGGGICGGAYPTYTHATIQNNTITGNSATYYGGGLYHCDGTIQNNTITGNSAPFEGGGLYECNGTIQNNTITGNSAGFGGGLIYCDGTIQNNTIAGNSATFWGGGLSDCDGTIQNNTITGNSARESAGGLMWCGGTIQNNTITGNSAVEYGGGLGWCNGTIQNNTITGNSAWSGGGLSDCGGTIQNNTITGNSAAYYGGGLAHCDGTIQNNTIAGNSAFDGGGGLYYCNGTIQNNTITGNSADFTGGLSDCSGTIQNNTITENSAGDSAGGLGWCDGTILNNTITGNSVARDGGGLHRCYGTIENNTITGNSAQSGGGLSYCKGTIRNCIIWGNTAPTGPQLCNSSTPTYSCIKGWTGGGIGNISADPLFVDPDGPDDDPKTYQDNDYHLGSGSPCIDSGENQDWMWAAFDADGGQRVANGIVDMGAYEFGSVSRVTIAKDGDVVTLRWEGFGDGEYTVEWTDDLVRNPWQLAPGSPLSEIMWSDIISSDVVQRFYRVESSGARTNPVGFVKVFPVKDGFTMVSVPLVPADNRLNGNPGCIGGMIAGALTGGPTAEEADVLWKWNASTQSYESAYLLDGLGEGYDGRWWNDETGDFSTMTFRVGECCWILRRVRQEASL